VVTGGCLTTTVSILVPKGGPIIKMENIPPTLQRGFTLWMITNRVFVSKVFVVMKKEFTYDDAYNTYHSGLAGRPVKSFVNRESAEAYSKSLNIEFINDQDDEMLDEYFSGLTGKIAASISVDRSLEQRVRYAEKIGFSVFYVAELDLE
jgi:hypothetical protein